MCGIVGMAGELDGKTDKALKHMLIFDSVRGEDSTGVASVGRHNDDVMVAKQLGNPFELFEHRLYPKTIANRQNRVVIGHNRYATSGGVSRATAHPFEFETLVGVHNGTLHNKHVLDNSGDFKVDSENLYHHIERNGLDAAIKIIRGAWALVWWDKEEDTLNFLRNKERTLYYTVNEAGNQLFWASEAWILDIALGRNDIKHKDIVLFEEDMLHSVPIPRGGKLGKPVLRKIVNDPAPVVVHTVGRVYDNRNNFQQGATTAGTSSTSPSTNVVKLEKPANVPVDSRSKVDAEFMRSKKLLMEAVVVVKEQSGAEYVLCFCPDKPFYEVRLYVHGKHAVQQDIGCEFEGDISGFVQTASEGVGYYKVSPHGIVITATADANAVHAVGTAGEYLTHDGKYLGKAAWEKEYGQCAFCSDNIEADDMLDKGARLSKSGDAFCGGCMKDDEIKQYVNIVEAN
jgi:predicted glutamine amidotransferase